MSDKNSNTDGEAHRAAAALVKRLGRSSAMTEDRALAVVEAHAETDVVIRHELMKVEREDAEVPTREVGKPGAISDAAARHRAYRENVAEDYNQLGVALTRIDGNEDLSEEGKRKAKAEVSEKYEKEATVMAERECGAVDNLIARRVAAVRGQRPKAVAEPSAEVAALDRIGLKIDCQGALAALSNAPKDQLLKVVRAMLDGGLDARALVQAAALHFAVDSLKLRQVMALVEDRTGDQDLAALCSDGQWLRVAVELSLLHEKREQIVAERELLSARPADARVLSTIVRGDGSRAVGVTQEEGGK